jgi:hypothetical protein
MIRTSNCNIQTPSMFHQEVQPKKNDGYIYLNPSAMQSKSAFDFKPFINKQDSFCSKLQYSSADPRLISASHGGQRLTFGNPPIDDKNYLDELSLDNYGKNYNTYSDINAGNITYYINNSIKDPLFKPIFSIPSRLTSTFYKDPMGSIKPQYYRQPLNYYDPINSDKKYYNGGLSWLEDSQEHREDILSKQMNKINEQRF